MGDRTEKVSSSTAVPGSAASRPEGRLHQVLGKTVALAATAFVIVTLSVAARWFAHVTGVWPFAGQCG